MNQEVTHEIMAASDASIRRWLRVQSSAVYIDVRLGELEWSGWRKEASTKFVVGRFYWYGVASFRSGRNELVFYQWPMRAATPDDMKPASDVFKQAIGRIEYVFHMGDRGWLVNWLNGNPVRRVLRISWFDPVVLSGEMHVVPAGDYRVGGRL